MCATLFLTYAVEMAKVVTGLMNKDTMDMVELCAQIRSLESSSWYKGAKQESMKLSGATGSIPPAPPGGKWCSSCSRSTQLIILVISGASVDFAVARGTRLKNADLEKMWRLRRRKLKLKKPLRLKRRKS